MFTSHLTRPLRWAIPVAVLGGIVALVWFVRPLEVIIGGEAGLLLLIVVAVRACVWSADTLHSLREEVRRRGEKLDGKR